MNLEIRSTFWVGSQWGGGAGESDRQVGLNRMGKVTPDINPKLTSNPKPKIDRGVVWAKLPKNRSDSSEIAQNRGGGLTGSRDEIGLVLSRAATDVCVLPTTCTTLLIIITPAQSFQAQAYLHSAHANNASPSVSGSEPGMGFPDSDGFGGGYVY